MRISKSFLTAVAAASLMLAGCSTEPETQTEQNQLSTDASASIKDFGNQDPSLSGLLKNSYGYAIFPNVGKGAAGIGGAYGRAQVFEQSNLVGYADLTQATVGASIGGANYAELIVFRTPEAEHKFETGQLTFDATASAVAVSSGAASQARWGNDMEVFIDPKGGLMADVSVGGQKFNFEPLH